VGETISCDQWKAWANAEGRSGLTAQLPLVPASYHIDPIVRPCTFRVIVRLLMIQQDRRSLRAEMAAAGNGGETGKIND